MAKTKAKTKTVKVRIRARQTVHYNQIVEMSRDDWDSLQAAIKSDDYRDADRVHKDLAEVYINKFDVFDADDIDCDEVEIEKE